MIYPKFSQRQLAVVVVCLLLTLGAVGVSFLIYFFNEPLLLNTVYTKTERYDILLPPPLSKEYTSSAAAAVEENATVDSYEALNVTNNNNHNNKFDAPIDGVVYDNDDNDATSIETEEEEDQSTQPQVDEQQNIYIDELEKPSSQQVDEGTPASGDYFASSKETDIDVNRLSKPRLYSVLGVGLGGTVPTEPVMKPTELKEPNLDQIYDNANMATANDDDDGEQEGEEDGSGSGYFDKRKLSVVEGEGIYDDETNNFIKRISLKMLQSQHDRALKPKPKPKQRIRTSVRPKRLKVKSQRKAHEEAARFNRVTDEQKERRMLPARFEIQSKANYRKAHNLATAGATTSTDSQLRDWEARTPTMNNHQQQQQLSLMSMSPAWLETRTRRIIGNVKKSEERSRQLLLCEKEEAGGGELCRMLFKGHLND